MRISAKMGYGAFNTNIHRLQEQNYFSILRQVTGKDIQSIADAPTRLMDTKKIIAQKAMKENYMFHNDYAIAEMRQVEDSARFISDNMIQIRDLSVTSLNLTYDGNVSAIAIYMKGLINDMLRAANTDFNGKYLFSGTATTPNGIIDNYPGMSNMPYELIEGEATADNPGGLYVVYKGNMEHRTINKDSHTNEQINMTGEQLFGAGGVDFFDPIIKIYNTLLFDKDGNQYREFSDYVDREDALYIASLQAIVAKNISTLDKETAMLASRRERLEVVNLQMVEEVTRLNEVKSLKEDVNMVKLLTKIAQEEAALQYSLDAGARINKFSLFRYI